MKSKTLGNEGICSVKTGFFTPVFDALTPVLRGQEDGCCPLKTGRDEPQNQGPIGLVMLMVSGRVRAPIAALVSSNPGPDF